MESISSLSLFAQIYIISVVGIIGLIIGSFLNVAALRLLSGESMVFPRSKCPKCGKLIHWYDNIPVLSYLMLKGKCRNCKCHISIQYPIVELITSVLFIFTFISFGITLKTLFLFILICSLIVITLTDLKEKVIFDITVVPLIPLGLVYNFFDIGNYSTKAMSILGISFNDAFISAIIGAAIGALFFEIFSRLGLLFVGQYAFGGGDTLIGAALGAWFGWQMILVILALSFVAQLIFGIPIILYNMYKDKDYKSIVFTFVLLFSVFIPYLGQITGLTKSFLGALFTLFLSFGLALSGIVVILKRSKERQSFTFLPFGPALVFGGLVVIFWGQEILSLYLKYLAG